VTAALTTDALAREMATSLHMIASMHADSAGAFRDRQPVTDRLDPADKWVRLAADADVRVRAWGLLADAIDGGLLNRLAEGGAR